MATEGKQLAVRGAMNVVVVTPRREVARRDVEAITAAGTLGEFGVLPGHIPYLTMLRTGVLVLESGGRRQVWAHGPGYLEVGAGGQVEILVEQCAEVAEIDRGAAQSELAEAEAELKKLDSAIGAEWQNLEARREWAVARLAAVARAGN